LNARRHTEFPDQFRARVRNLHEAAFTIHEEASTLVQQDLQGRRAFPTHVEIVIHMLAVQGVKAHAAVMFLCEQGLIEDSATICRRLMELGVQAMYIGQESDPILRRRRAGQYAAYLWRQLPRRAKRRLPLEIRRTWTSLERGYGRFIKRKYGWGPTFKHMFKEVGSLDLYETDYSFLSSIAHGSGDLQVFQFAVDTIRTRDDRFQSRLLVYASRYLLALTDPWRTIFDVEMSAELEACGKKLTGWDFAAEGDGTRAS